MIPGLAERLVEGMERKLDAELFHGNTVTVHLDGTYAHYLPVSRAFLDDQAGWQAEAARREAMTPEERAAEDAERNAAATAARAGERARHVRVPLTLERLLDALCLDEQAAAHLVQPYCSCDMNDYGGRYRCAHAEDEGITL